MGKGHRDNHAARVKRGSQAFQKKAKRRKAVHRCIECGARCRPQKLQQGLFCPRCVERHQSAPKPPPITIHVPAGPRIAFPVTQALAELFAERARQQEQDFIHGQGTEKPRGILS